MPASRIMIEVAYAEPHRQRVVALAVAPGTSARDAVREAELPSLFPERDAAFFERAPLGIFGQALKAPDHRVLEQGDRVEVYRPLVVDPKQARLARARGGD
ncbi:MULTISPECIES: RnfH family protein [Chromohalobacter]|nr:MULTISPECIES: RnfH family protein [Chromohalobacter]MCI0510053.1 RnfH family protein [Chromohalobacter sp.]MCI0593788.1 RnfH family protein [Chromohalobacter sp.]